MYILNDYDLNKITVAKFEKTLELNTRETVDDSWGSSSWVWGRWILFVIFVVFLLVIFLGTIRANKRRRTLGQAPIRGTAWMTPPTYRQSERDYNANGSAANGHDFVPKYTAEANDQDLGYYDARGEFHPNSKSEYLPPPPLVHEVDSNASTTSNSHERPNIPPPQSVVTMSRSANNSATADSPIPQYQRGNIAISDDASVDNLDFSRYNYIDANSTSNTARSNQPTSDNNNDLPRPPKAA
ncbi:hypothetical protein TPHA_0H00680 [Tetrapisispora phaffii CBS 4417]|uniref:Uncharacterized protein n=1 Tax=Tetrapisispora phaffii (strain ATCC 24235 / CBS 4417 / NBRC 1672 / NRRL Y-8282 / UCD 70-5) TaxID=1071381 RepID=G8BWX4_TETPH|nr:hypothetical protein TPHA_0H00680 [Tetrapisispora phaffii CBS 4417]CCE64278.1 hypothetical protein TPHA_0H00680 [Tetrapisispora phaffii CBS 4417]